MSGGGRLRAVFFDLDGTLYDEAGGMARALDETLGIMADLVGGLDVAAARRLYPEVGRVVWESADLLPPGPDPRARSSEIRRVLWGRLMERCGRPVSDELAGRLASLYTEARRRHHRLFPEVQGVLDRLDDIRRDDGLLHVGLITNGPADLQRDKLDFCGLAGRFEPVVVSAELGAAKPDAQIFAAALERAALTPDEALYIGDNPEKDVAGARQAGWRAVWVNRTQAPFPPGLPPPDWEVPDLDALPGIVSAA